MLNFAGTATATLLSLSLMKQIASDLKEERHENDLETINYI